MLEKGNDQSNGEFTI